MTQIGGQRGFALLAVLWTLGFLALLGTALVAIARQNMQRVDNLLDGARAEAAAEGALHQAIFAVLDPSEQRWQPDGSSHLLRSGPNSIEVRIEDENGKVNPNIAPVELLQALIVQLGTDPRTAAALATTIVEWRSRGRDADAPGPRAARYAAAGRDYAPPGAPFERLDELAAVLGMTTVLLERLRPHLSLFTVADPDATSTVPSPSVTLVGYQRPAFMSGS